MKTLLSALIALSVIAGVAGSANAASLGEDVRPFFDKLQRDFG